jgi:hypothetical protein
MIPLAIRTLVRNNKLFELGENILDFETFLIILVGIDEL